MSVSDSNPLPDGKAEQPPVVVKKYANRRLYNTESSSYITLDSLAGMIRIGRDFVVYDAKTGEDITRGVLTQIIVEEESKGRAMLPTAFLRQIIGFYGDSLQQFVPSYLEQAMSSFATQQEQMRTAMQQTMGNLFPGMKDIGRQNVEMMERAMSLFTPFYRSGLPTPLNGEAPAPQPPDPPSGEMVALQHEIDTLRQQLAAARTEALKAELLKTEAPARTGKKAAEKTPEA
ncbi:polyhydroxyalkanoate synthesis repressor PhaR [Acidisphaera sp. L21]|jgi:polyhydroxyalkanoate synthesis repressor PhaR|uniref:polyhydroxyalkanoate synthesis repressor PhaR n=1 Tax=Acidisphaera sp. L21 TaxID=1641851 RepID=UPI00131AF9AB|nr:polyhydroxyalkanoate synthesis repressor PhaR [Acidisphaera sp. L21]